MSKQNKYYNIDFLQKLLFETNNDDYLVFKNNEIVLNTKDINELDFILSIARKPRNLQFRG